MTGRGIIIMFNGTEGICLGSQMLLNFPFFRPLRRGFVRRKIGKRKISRNKGYGAAKR